MVDKIGKTERSDRVSVNPYKSNAIEEAYEKPCLEVSYLAKNFILPSKLNELLEIFSSQHKRYSEQ